MAVGEVRLSEPWWPDVGKAEGRVWLMLTWMRAEEGVEAAEETEEEEEELGSGGGW